MGSKSTPTMILMMVVTLVCAAIIVPAAAGALLLLLSPSVLAQQEETSLGEREDLARGIVSGVLDGSGDNDDDNSNNEENHDSGTAGDNGDTNTQTAVQIIDQDQDQRAANLAAQLGLSADIVGEVQEEEVTSTTTPTTTAPTPPTGTVTVFKQVVGGTAQPSDFTMRVEGNNPSPSTFQGSSSGTTVTLGQGSYQLTETTVADDYTPSFSSGCSGTISAGQTQTCTVTNTFTPPTTTPTVFCFTVEFTSTVVRTPCFSTQQECETGEEILIEQGAVARIVSSCKGFETLPEGGDRCIINIFEDPELGLIRSVGC
jgi:hypothetical protein